MQIFGIIPLLIFAFASDHPSKRNYAKATLLLMVIAIGFLLIIGLIYVIVMAIMFGGTAAILQESLHY